MAPLKRILRHATQPGSSLVLVLLSPRSTDLAETILRDLLAALALTDDGRGPPLVHVHDLASNALGSINAVLVNAVLGCIGCTVVSRREVNINRLRLHSLLRLLSHLLNRLLHRLLSILAGLEDGEAAIQSHQHIGDVGIVGGLEGGEQLRRELSSSRHLCVELINTSLYQSAETRVVSRPSVNFFNRWKDHSQERKPKREGRSEFRRKLEECV